MNGAYEEYLAFLNEHMIDHKKDAQTRTITIRKLTVIFKEDCMILVGWLYTDHISRMRSLAFSWRIDGDRFRFIDLDNEIVMTVE